MYPKQQNITELGEKRLRQIAVKMRERISFWK